jgi:tetratricopeptide (TPR) repeat protein
VATRVQGAWGLGACAGTANDLDAARDHHRRGLTWARADGLVDAAQRLLNGLGATAERANDYAEAVTRFLEAHSLAERRSDEEAAIATLLNVAETERKRGHLGASDLALRKAMARIDRRRSPRIHLVATLRTASFAAAVGSFEEATHGFEEAAQLADELGDARLGHVIRTNIALVRLEASEDGFDELLERIAAVEGVGELNVGRWARIEAALHAPDEEAAERALVVGEDAGPHMAFVLALARHRFGGPPVARAPFLEAGFIFDDVVDLRGVGDARVVTWRRRCSRFRARLR